MSGKRTRVFTGVLPETGQRVLVQVFEDEDEIEGMEVALREGEEGRWARWGMPATMEEEING